MRADARPVMAHHVIWLPSSAVRICVSTVLCRSRRTAFSCYLSGPVSLHSSFAPLVLSNSRFHRGSVNFGKPARRSSTVVDTVVRPAVAQISVTSSGSSPAASVDSREDYITGESPKGQDREAKKNSDQKYLLGKSEDDLIKLSMKLGEQKYRGRQIHQLIYRAKAKHVENFLHIPQRMRDALLAEGWQVGRSVIHHIARSSDGTVKVLLRLEDNRLVETVGIPVYSHLGKIERLTACVSSQVGCALKCAFCATGKGGFARNLKPHEIIEQVLIIDELFKSRVTNVVFMGMGEPLMNLPALVPALRALNKEVLIGQRMMTISTVGVPNTIAKLASLKLQSTLAISLHAPNQKLRSQIVPSAKGYPLESLLTDCRNYFLETGRRVSIEYTLLSTLLGHCEGELGTLPRIVDSLLVAEGRRLIVTNYLVDHQHYQSCEAWECGVNDQREHAEELANLLHHWRLGRHVNVIPYNPIADAEFRRPNKAQVMAFVLALNNRKVTTSIRQTRGLDANAACGQLRNNFQKFAMSDIPQGIPS